MCKILNKYLGLLYSLVALYTLFTGIDTDTVF